MVVCGGKTSGNLKVDTCHAYDAASNKWVSREPMKKKRKPVYSCVVGDEWVIGGTTQASDVRRGGVDTEGPKLPVGSATVCLLTLDESTIFQSDAFGTQAYLIDWTEGDTKGTYEDVVRGACYHSIPT